MSATYMAMFKVILLDCHGGTYTIFFLEPKVTKRSRNYRLLGIFVTYFIFLLTGVNRAGDFDVKMSTQEQ